MKSHVYISTSCIPHQLTALIIKTYHMSSNAFPEEKDFFIQEKLLCGIGRSVNQFIMQFVTLYWNMTILQLADAVWFSCEEKQAEVKKDLGKGHCHWYLKGSEQNTDKISSQPDKRQIPGV